MATCPNKNLPEWQELDKTNPKYAHFLWNLFDGFVPETFYNNQNIDWLYTEDGKIKSDLKPEEKEGIIKFLDFMKEKFGMNYKLINEIGRAHV